MFLYAETPLHIGTGTSLGVVDLPIQREKHTGFPLGQASGIKGSVRNWFEKHTDTQIKDDQKIKLTFGPETNGSEHAGAVTFTDARLLLFPVRSLKGIFAWISCKSVLERLKRDMEIVGKTFNWNVPSPEKNQAIGTNQAAVAEANKVVLEEFSFDFQTSNDVQQIAQDLSDNALPSGNEYKFWRDRVATNLLILPENAFRDFTQFATELVARIKLNPSKTTGKDPVTGEEGNLFYEENLPSDTLLYSLVLATDPLIDSSNRPEGLKTAADVVQYVALLDNNRLQIGGDETIGRGIVKVKFLSTS